MGPPIFKSFLEALVFEIDNHFEQKVFFWFSI